VGEVVCSVFGWQAFTAPDGSDVSFKHNREAASVSTALGINGITDVPDRSEPSGKRIVVEI
jgi:hypothetical protein